MPRRLTALAAGLTLAAAIAAPAALAAVRGAPARHASARTTCRTLRPSGLRFSRRLGRTVGTLRWHVPAPRRAHGRHAARRRAIRYRVSRDGKVVGQTRHRALRIPVTLGHAHRFAVVPLTASGHATRCGTAKRLRVSYHNPGAPLGVAITGDEAGLQLSWLRGARGDVALAGYRMLRDGKPVGQTGATSWRLPAAANRSYRFAVLAVDRRGHTSAASATVTIVTGHAPPSPPAGVQGVSVAADAIGVQWQRSSVRAGRIVGYRVLRNGVTVAQTKGTSLVLDHLAPSTSYRLSVVAIDGLGYASAPSAPADVRTQDPIPTSGHAQAFLLASTDQSFADFQAHYRGIGLVYPTYFDCTPGADLAGADDPLVTRWAQARAVKVLPRINCQRTAVIDRILTDPATRAQWIDRVTALAHDTPYDGVSLDFEAGPAADRAALTSFVAELAGRLHADGKLLTICASPKTYDSRTHPRSGIFDYKALPQSADWVFVMAWGLHWATSAPGAQDDATWAQQVAGYVATMPLHQKFVYGTNLYAMDWPAGGGPSHPATAYQYDDFVPGLGSLGASIQLDAAANAYHATYADAGGVGHDVWYPDAGTIGWRIRLARSDGLGGIGFWRLGREDQRLWDDPLLAPGAAW